MERPQDRHQDARQRGAERLNSSYPGVIQPTDPRRQVQGFLLNGHLGESASPEQVQKALSHRLHPVADGVERLDPLGRPKPKHRQIREANRQRAQQEKGPDTHIRPRTRYDTAGRPVQLWRRNEKGKYVNRHAARRTG